MTHGPENLGLPGKGQAAQDKRLLGAGEMPHNQQRPQMVNMTHQLHGKVVQPHINQIMDKEKVRILPYSGPETNSKPELCKNNEMESSYRTRTSKDKWIQLVTDSS